MSVKDDIINHIIEIEGDFVDDPDDSGGATRFGITERVARANGYEGAMRSLPRSLAFKIYVDKYWHPISGDYLEQLDHLVAREVMDTGVNMGTPVASKFLQRALNILNDRERIFDDIAVDGDIGPGTLLALRKYLTERDAQTLMTVLNCLQGAYYIDIAERRVKDERFIYGWFKNRVVL
jgi:lysozyme family protein